jgi:phosphohistidine phosphatase
MNRLYLLRHAKAAPQAPGTEDRDRPLADKGGRAVREVGVWAEEAGLAPELILCSPAVRTRQTLALLLPHLGGRPEVKLEEALYLANAEALAARLRRVAGKCPNVLLVGHNPGIEALAVALVHGPAGPLGKRLREGMPTAALAAFELDGPWAALDDGAARLTHYITPKAPRE